MTRLFSFILVLAVLLIGGVYLAYGEVDPCRVLAVESSRRSAVPTAIAQPLARLSDSQESESECASDVLHSWGERLRELLP